MTDLALLGFDIRSEEAVAAFRNLDRMTASSVKAEQGQQKLARQSRAAALGLDGFGRNANRASRAAGGAVGGIRNLGLQLNQVAQQGAITGNFLQAFAFQLPDILLGFGTAGVLAGVAAGALTPLITNLIAGQNEAASFADNLDELRGAIADYEKIAKLATGSTADLNAEFSTASSGLRTALSLLEGIGRRETQRSIDSIASDLGGVLGTAGDGDRRSELARFFEVNIFLAFTEAQREARAEARQLTAEFVNQQDALKEAEGDLQKQADALGKLITATTTLSDLDGERSAEEDAILKTQAETLALIEQQLALVKEADDAIDGTNSKLLTAYNLYADTRMEANGLAEEIGQAAVDALALSGYDITSPISSAAKEAAQLAANLGISVLAAINLQNLQSSRVYSGRGSVQPGDTVSTLGPDGIQSLIDAEARRQQRLAGRLTDDQRRARAIFDDTRTPAERYRIELKEINRIHEMGLINEETRRRAIRDLGKEFQAFEGVGVDAIQGMTDAWGEFVVRGFNDFRGFVNSVLGSFQNMIAQMISITARNRILIGLGLGAGGATSATAGGLLNTVVSGAGGGFLGSIGTGSLAGGFAGGSGVLGGLGQSVGGVFSGGGLSSLFNISGAASAAGGGIAATIGAALPIVGLGLALFGLFKRKPIISQKDFTAIQVGLDLTGQALFDTGKAGQRAARDLRNIAGSTDEFTNKTQTFFDLFFTEEEKRQKAQEAVNSTFESLGLALPGTNREFRDLVQSLDLTTSEGRKTYNTLLDLAPTFAGLTDEANRLNDALSGSQGIFATLQDEQFVRAQLAQGNPEGFTTLTAKLDTLVQAVIAGNVRIIQNTGDTAAEMRRSNLTPQA